MLFRGKIGCSIKYRVLTDTFPLVKYKDVIIGITISFPLTLLIKAKILPKIFYLVGIRKSLTW